MRGDKNDEIERENTSWQLSSKEWGLGIFIVILGVLGILGPHITQYDSYHDFADQSHLLGLQHAWDVLSNLPFAIIGLWGVWTLKKFTVIEGSAAAREMLLLFFWGLVITCLCSSYYHLSPDNASVFLDRLGMSVAFAGILAFAVSICISDRAGKATSYLILFVGPVSLWIWQQTDNLLAWSVLQAGGMLVVVCIAVFSNIRKELKIALFCVIGWYFLSKLCELGDQAIYDWTLGLLPGHSLKHIVASFAGLPIICFLRRLALKREGEIKEKYDKSK